MRRKIIYIFVVIITIGALLRLCGIGFGLPDLLHPDEPFEINRALRLASGSIELDRAGKGGFFYLIFLVLIVSFLSFYLFGIVRSPEDFAYFFVSHESSFYLIARLLSAAIGVLSIYIIFKIARKCWGDFEALIASFLLSISWLSVSKSHYATVDITLVFFLLLSFYYLISYAECANKKDLFKATLFGGLSVVTKLNGIVIIISIFTTIILSTILNPKSKKAYARHTIAASMIFLLVVGIGEPGYIKKIYDIVTKKPQIVEQLPTKQISNKASSPNLVNFYGNILTKEFNIILLLIFILSAFYFIYLFSKNNIIFISFIVPYLIAICFPFCNLFYPRYLLPIIPLIILIIASGIGAFTRYLINREINAKTIYVIETSILLIILFPNISLSIKTSLEYWDKSERVKAKEWFYANAADGASVLMSGCPEHRSQQLVPLTNNEQNINQMIQRLSEEAPGKSIYWKLRQRHLNTLNIPRYDLILMHNLENWIDYDVFKRADIEYVVISRAQIKQQYTDINSLFINSQKQFYQRMVKDPDVIKIAEFSEILIFKNKSKNHSYRPPD